MFGDNRSLLVTIQCMAYNHGPYIRQCLEGFVKQKTDFRFEAVIHDDASTDGTAAIVREYAEKYPDIIKPIFETENQYSKHDGSLNRIMNEHTYGKYVAFCEGDDYWTDPLKLQKQVDFLESHPDYSMCFHNVDILDEASDAIVATCSNIESKEYFAEEILGKWTVPTCSSVLRRDCVVEIPNRKDFFVGDNVLWSNSLSKGRVFGFEETMGVYRRISNGWTHIHFSDKKKRDELALGWIAHYKALKECFPSYSYIYDKLILKYLSIIVIRSLYRDPKNLKKYLVPAIKSYKMQFFYALFCQLGSYLEKALQIIHSKLF